MFPDVDRAEWLNKVNDYLARDISFFLLQHNCFYFNSDLFQLFLKQILCIFVPFKEIIEESNHNNIKTRNSNNNIITKHS